MMFFEYHDLMYLVSTEGFTSSEALSGENNYSSSSDGLTLSVGVTRRLHLITTPKSTVSSRDA
ncbi:MAG: hypothetical protein Q8909_12015, partial [Bacteroidota bacterium]|nr:hypothetical protein [Bacteroidota bacterium]